MDIGIVNFHEREAVSQEEELANEPEETEDPSAADLHQFEDSLHSFKDIFHSASRYLDTACEGLHLKTSEVAVLEKSASFQFTSSCQKAREMAHIMTQKQHQKLREFGNHLHVVVGEFESAISAADVPDIAGYAYYQAVNYVKHFQVRKQDKPLTIKKLKEKSVQEKVIAEKANLMTILVKGQNKFIELFQPEL